MEIYREQPTGSNMHSQMSRNASTVSNTQIFRPLSPTASKKTHNEYSKALQPSIDDMKQKLLNRDEKSKEKHLNYPRKVSND